MAEIWVFGDFGGFWRILGGFAEKILFIFPFLRRQESGVFLFRHMPESGGGGGIGFGGVGGGGNS